jgi:hypothetical protein
MPMTEVKDFAPRSMKTEPFVHWASTLPGYTLSADGKFWVRAADGSKFCNLSNDDHEEFMQYQHNGRHSIDSWCTRCDDMTAG